MAIDMRQFQATFFAESREGLDAMESGLLSLEAAGNDLDTVNTIFRAAHSIKGGAATFGFKAITNTTHVLETLLDQVRGGKRSVDGELSDALLASVDILRELLSSAEAGNPDDTGRSEPLNARLSELLNGAPAAAPAVAVHSPATTTPAPSAVESAATTHWQVDFAPHENMFITGNDPLRILRELARLGEMEVNCDTAKLPTLTDLDPHTAYLSWTLELPASIKRAHIADAFSWVEDECDLRIEGVGQHAGGAAVASQPVVPETVAASAPPVAPPPVIATPPPGATPATTTTAAGADSKTNVTPMAASKAAEPADSSIRVNISKVDALINLVGELVITQAMLKQQSSALDPSLHEKLLNGLTQLDRNTRDLQEAVMSVRMLPVEFVFSRFPRMVRDLASRLGKRVNLRTSGEGTELDKGVIERIVDPLVHLVRNSVDHGLETPDLREASGKNPVGTVTLSASHQGGHIVIEIIDDGRGLNREKILAKAVERGLPVSEQMPDGEVWKLIFHPGLSTADQVTDVSGRGVGMDVVRQNIAALGGDIDIESVLGQGTRVTIRLPLTLAILDGMTVSVGNEIFVLPLGYVVESLQPGPGDIKRVTGSNRVLKVRSEYVPIHDMGELFNVPRGPDTVRLGTVVVVENGGRKLAMEVDELVGQQQVVVKSIESNYKRINGIAGATILGDGRVALIVDIVSIIRAQQVAA